MLTQNEVARLRAARRGADEGILSATNASFSTPDGKILLQNFNLQVLAAGNPETLLKQGSREA